jgi:3-methylfumaryl-CoA hydratase
MINADAISNFIGRQRTEHDIASVRSVGGLAALLDHENPPWTPRELPPLGHWLCFPPSVAQSKLGGDGHPLRTPDGLLPSVDLPRRMWAGSRIRFAKPILLGTPIDRRTTVIAAKPKSGRTGSMLFVTLKHEIIRADGSVAIVEEQDIVYREASRPTASAPALEPAQLASAGPTRTVVPDPTMLFRYSALTFNAHRIHYDSEYARNVEGYEALVVHGPYVATLLMDHVLRQHTGITVTSFSFRAKAAVFAGQSLLLQLVKTADGAELTAVGPSGIAMTATAEFVCP